MLENKHLRSFLRVLDLGGYSRAARSLNIAQPALSQHVKKLEEQLGVTLLDRSAHGVSPTYAGRQFAEHARQILELVERAERSFDAGPQALFGEVKLGLPGSVCPVLAMPLITRIRDSYPNIRLIISELMSGDLADLLRDGRMDLAILFNTSETEDFTSEPLVRESLCLVGPPDDPALDQDTIAAEGLTNFRLVATRPPHGLRLLIERWMNETGIGLTIEYEADAPSVLVGMAAQGICHTIISPTAVRHDIEDGRITAAEIIDPRIDRTACLCGSKRLRSDAAREVVHDVIKQVASDVVATGDWKGTRVT